MWKTIRVASLFIAGSLLLAGVASAQQFSVTSWGHKDGLPSTSVHAVTQTGDGFLWLATGDGLIRFDGFQFIPQESSAVAGEPFGRIGRDLSAISAVESPAAAVVPDALRDRLHGQTIRKTLRDSAGAWWIATESGGLFRIASSGEIQQFTRASGLPSDHIWDVFEDRQGNFWAGTQNGLARLKRGKFSTYTVRDGLLSDIAISLAAAADDGVWIGSRSGLQHFTAPGNANDTLLQGTAVGDLLALQGGALLALTSSGIREVGPHEIDVPATISAIRNIEQIAESAQGDLWLYGGQPGLWHGARGAEPKLINEPALAGQVVLSMRGGPRDQVWLGLENGSLILRPPAGSHVFTSADGLTGGAIRFLSPQPDGTLWVASARGLAYFDGEHFRHWNRDSGLPGDQLLWVIPDPHGNLWLGYSTGVARLKTGTLLHPSSQAAPLQYDFYDDGDGLKSNPEAYGRSPVALTSDGRLWVSMSEGIGMIDPNRAPRDTFPPPVHILGLTADGHELNVVNGVKIPANTRTLQIVYTGIALNEPRKVRFRYRLEGFDPGWQDAGARRTAFYTNLRPGDYRFRVLAANADGVWNETGDSVTFELLPAFYQTPWFLILCGFAVATLVFMGYRLRVRLAARELSARYEARMAERTRIAQDLHDSLVQELLGINLQLEIAEQLTPPETAARQPLRRALELSRTALASGRSALHQLRRRPFTRADIESTLRDTEQSMTGFRDRVVFGSSGSERPIRAAAAEELVHIVREALRNAILHAGQNEISIHSEYGEQDLAWVVRDRGPGISAELLDRGRPGHFGVRGMRERADRIGSSLTVNTSPATGTQWTLRVPASVAYEPEA